MSVFSVGGSTTSRSGVLSKRALETPCPSVFFGDGASIWETVGAAMAAKMNSQRRLLNLRRQFKHYREGELREETVQL